MPSFRHAAVDRDALARLILAFAPGARLVGTRRLRGGLGARTRVLDIEDGAGARSKVVLRVYLPGRLKLTPDRARREWRTLQVVGEAGIPAPEPLLLDAEGHYFGEPAMLLSYLPGRSLYQPHRMPDWAEELARAMHLVHTVTPDRYDLSFLPRHGLDEIASELRDMRPKVEASDDGLAAEAYAVLRKYLDAIERIEPCLIHDDFWPGNTVWQRGKLTGVIDWADACLGDPRLDPPQCAIDACIANGLECSEAVLDAYDHRSPRPMPDKWYFEVLIGLKALMHYRIWVLGYHDAGLTFIMDELARERVQHFLRRALSKAG